MHAYRTGQDIHTLTAAEVFGVPAEKMSKETRNRAKAVNFGIVYGISPFGLAAQLGIEQHEARLYIETYFERYEGVREVHRSDAGGDAARAEGADGVWAGAADSGYSEPQCESARICRAHGGEHSAARNGGRPDQAGDDSHRSTSSRTKAQDADDAAGA